MYCAYVLKPCPKVHDKVTRKEPWENKSKPKLEK